MRERRVNVSDDLLDRARRAVGRDDINVSDLLRLGLATLAGVDVAEYTPKQGRPRKVRADEMAGAA